jgi:hypothetical protein
MKTMTIRFRSDCGRRSTKSDDMKLQRLYPYSYREASSTHSRRCGGRKSSIACHYHHHYHGKCLSSATLFD